MPLIGVKGHHAQRLHEQGIQNDPDKRLTSKVKAETIFKARKTAGLMVHSPCLMISYDVRGLVIPIEGQGFCLGLLGMAGFRFTLSYTDCKVKLRRDHIDLISSKRFAPFRHQSRERCSTTSCY